MIIKETKIDETLPVEEIAKQLTSEIKDVGDEWAEPAGEVRGRPVFALRYDGTSFMGLVFADGSDAEIAMLTTNIQERFPQLTEADATENVRMVRN